MGFVYIMQTEFYKPTFSFKLPWVTKFMEDEKE